MNFPAGIKKIKLKNIKGKGGLTAGPHLPGSPARPLLCFARTGGRTTRRSVLGAAPAPAGGGRPATRLGRAAAGVRGAGRAAAGRSARGAAQRHAQGARGGAMARAAARGVPRRWGGISGADGQVLARGPRRPCGSRRHRASARRGPPRRVPAAHGGAWPRAAAAAAFRRRQGQPAARRGGASTREVKRRRGARRWPAGGHREARRRTRAAGGAFRGGAASIRWRQRRFRWGIGRGARGGRRGAHHGSI